MMALYLVTRLGKWEFYVVADSFDAAAELALAADTDERPVEKIEVVASTDAMSSRFNPGARKLVLQKVPK